MERQSAMATALPQNVNFAISLEVWQIFLRQVAFQAVHLTLETARWLIAELHLSCRVSGRVSTGRGSPYHKAGPTAVVL
jgi:hypothetical protein